MQKLTWPWTQIAVLKETEGRGPYCSLVMAVVVTKDVLVFICFSLNVEISALVRLARQLLHLCLSTFDKCRNAFLPTPELSRVVPPNFLLVWRWWGCAACRHKPPSLCLA